MMSSERMVLRAELLHQSRQIVAHTTALNAESAIVRTDEPLNPGDAITLRLSFRGLLAPLELETHVVSKEAGNGHGYLAVVTLGFDHASAEQTARLTTLLAEPDPTSWTMEGDICRILVVEDSPLMCDMVQLGADRISERPVRVVVDTADSAEHALELLGRERYELALVDLYLVGKMSGADMVRALRSDQPADLPVIGFSVGGSAARDAFLEAGADLFLDKPVMVKDVFATLKRLLLLRPQREA